MVAAVVEDTGRVGMRLLAAGTAVAGTVAAEGEEGTAVAELADSVLSCAS